MTSGLYQIQRNLIPVYPGGLIIATSVQSYSIFLKIYPIPWHALDLVIAMSHKMYWWTLQNKVLMNLLRFLMLQVPYCAVDIGILGICRFKQSAFRRTG